MNEENMKIVGAFQGAPETQEKREIAKKYMTDEITVLKFVSLAEDYLKKYKLEYLLPSLDKLTDK